MTVEGQTRGALERSPGVEASIASALASPRAVERLRLAGLPELRAEERMQLARDPHYLVRRAVASSRNAHPEALELLAWDSHVEVRVAVLHNPLTPPGLQRRMDLPAIRASRRLGTLLEALEASLRETASALAENWAGSLEELLDAAELVA